MNKQKKGSQRLKVRNMETLKTLETKKEIIIGLEVRFADLWDGDGDGEELLHSGAVSPDNENVVDFEIVSKTEDILDTIVRVTDIY